MKGMALNSFPVPCHLNYKKKGEGMSKKIDIELALHEGRYGEVIRYLDKRIDVVSQAVDRLINAVEGKKPKEGVKKS